MNHRPNKMFFILPESNKFALPLNAQMAKLVDALPSGGSARKGVLVRIQFWAQAI